MEPKTAVCEVERSRSMRVVLKHMLETTGKENCVGINLYRPVILPVYAVTLNPGPNFTENLQIQLGLKLAATFTLQIHVDHIDAKAHTSHILRRVAVNHMLITCKEADVLLELPVEEAPFVSEGNHQGKAKHSLVDHFNWASCDRRDNARSLTFRCWPCSFCKWCGRRRCRRGTRCGGLCARRCGRPVLCLSFESIRQQSRGQTTVMRGASEP
mmetsp:Transcript_766/g.1468  ORF Transcript_766/g.1468 Transcript_766/m.1468 type:complete len:213 (+) Transcript_766:707-1345(+)